MALQLLMPSGRCDRAAEVEACETATVANAIRQARKGAAFGQCELRQLGTIGDARRQALQPCAGAQVEVCQLGAARHNL